MTPAHRLTYAEWAEALGQHFFKDEYRGAPVMFFVDDAALASIYGGSGEDAAESLTKAVRAQLNRGWPRRLFSDVESETRRWRLQDGDSTPPCLPLLALAVLAATRMRRTRDRAAHNYYRPFQELLGGDASIGDLQASSGDDLPYLWESLQWWLDDKHHGELGLSTIVGGAYTYGYADSQTLFSSSDWDKLTRFFRWIRLEPGEQLESDELIAYFRAWAAGRDDLSEGAAYMLESDEHATQLAGILAAAAGRWTGVVQEEGDRWGDVLVVLELFPQRRLSLVATRPDRFPEQLSCRGPLGGPATVLTSSYDGYYDPLPDSLLAPALASGLQLAAGRARLRLPRSDVHVLEKNRDLGNWASVAQLSPGEPAWLLVRQGALEPVLAYLDASARSGWDLPERERIAPAGWRLVRDVVVDASSGQEVPAALDQIVPRTRNRLSLKGGLPLPRGSGLYLLGGEPDVSLPPPSGERGSFELKVDDAEPIVVPRTATRVRLAKRGLEEGAHSVETQGIRRSFTTVRSRGLLSQPAAQAIVDPLEHAGDERPVAPLILPVGASRGVLLGSRPGEIEEVAAPPRPAWMARAKLGFQFFEVVPGFEVTWVITTWSLAPTTRVRLRHARDPAPSDPAMPREQVVAWADALSSAPAPGDAAAAELWSSYLEQAARVGST